MVLGSVGLKVQGGEQGFGASLSVFNRCSTITTKYLLLQVEQYNTKTVVAQLLGHLVVAKCSGRVPMG